MIRGSDDFRRRGTASPMPVAEAVDGAACRALVATGGRSIQKEPRRGSGCGRFTLRLAARVRPVRAFEGRSNRIIPHPGAHSVYDEAPQLAAVRAEALSSACPSSIWRNHATRSITRAKTYSMTTPIDHAFENLGPGWANHRSARRSSHTAEKSPSLAAPQGRRHTQLRHSDMKISSGVAPRGERCWKPASRSASARTARRPHD